MLRLILVKPEGVVDECIAAHAKERPEAELIDAWLRRQGVQWSSITRVGGLTVSHSHTSVRVMTTLLRTAAWYSGVPFTELPQDRSLTERPPADLLAELNSAK
jgi:hypothetical protein